MKNYLIVYGFVLLNIFYADFYADSTPFANPLIKRFFIHQGAFSDRIVMYFSVKSMVIDCKEKEVNSQRKKVCTFFIPASYEPTNKEVVDAINQLKNIKTSFCSYTLEYIGDPKGIKFIIEYDPAKILCMHQVSRTITDQQSLIVSLYKKDALNVLKQDSDKILKHVSNDKHKNKLKIVIDCGHGGDDAGIIGMWNVKEKDINLKIGKKVASLLARHGHDVNLTRTSDIYVPVGKRTTLSNGLPADIFLSIHSNGGVNKNTGGIETFWSTTEHLIISNTCDVGLLRARYQQRDNASKQLAELVHKNILYTVKSFYQPCDRLVKQSELQVLIGTEMPSALVEVGFLSNPQDASFLVSTSYQKALAEGICKGILEYIKHMTFT